MKDDYLKINKDTWNKRSEIHFDSTFYDNESFLKGRNSLNSIELGLLGNLKGKKVLHLQCHFGQDTLSLERLGAEVTGVDFSDVAIEKANQLASKLGSSARFICCDLYRLPEVLEEEFDMVFTSYGTIGWLPDIERWAKVVSLFLRTGGHFVFAEFHPVVWMFSDDFSQIQYRYFNDEPIVEMESSYTDGAENLSSKNVSWNHGLAEVVTALLTSNIQIEQFQEFDYSPYNCFLGTKETPDGKFFIEKMGRKLPMVYAIKGLKK